MQIAFRAGEMVDFQAFDLLVDRGQRREQGRDDDHGAQIWRNPIGKFQGGQYPRTEPTRQDAIGDGDRDIHCRDQPQDGEETKQPDADPRLPRPQRDQRQKQNDRRKTHDAAPT